MVTRKKTESKAASAKSRPRKIQFEFSAPEAKEVAVAGSFNQWNNQTNPMKKGNKGIWKATLSLEPGRYEYRFFVDGLWENDPSCTSRVANEFGGQNCVMLVS